MSHLNDVRAFMAEFDQAIAMTPGFPQGSDLKLRVRLIAEEAAEFFEACGYRCVVWVGETGTAKPVFSRDTRHDPDDKTPNRDLSAAADALVDLEYVTLGTHLSFGIDPESLWNAVHRANMEKRGGPIVDGKQRKPAGWKPPDIKSLLVLQGYEELSVSGLQANMIHILSESLQLCLVDNPRFLSNSMVRISTWFTQFERYCRSVRLDANEEIKLARANLLEDVSPQLESLLLEAIRSVSCLSMRRAAACLLRLEDECRELLHP